jgi:hypothetical protein
MTVERLYRVVKGTGASGEEKTTIVRVYGTWEDLQEELPLLKAEFSEGVFTPGQPMSIHGVFTPRPEEDIYCIDIILISGGKDGFVCSGSKSGGVDERASDNGDGDGDRGYAKADRNKKG